MSFGVVMFWLLFGHCLSDYALQTDFIARGKNPFSPTPGQPWYYIMLAHCFIHGGMVSFFTGSVLLGLAELVTHFAIDCLKCARRINIHVDQLGHVLCKLLWAITVCSWYTPEQFYWLRGWL